MFTVPAKRLADLHGLAADIDRLAAGTPTLATAWLTSWWEAYGGDAPSGDQQLELCCLAVYDSQQDAKMIGFAPFCRRVSRQKGTGSPKGTVLRWIGSGEVYSDYMTLLAEPGREDHVVEAVAEWLLDNSCQRWDTIELDGVTAQDEVILKLVRRMQQAGHAIYARGDADCWQLGLAEDWDAYLARLSKSHRKQVRRAVRDSFDTRECQLRVAKTEVELAEMFETFRSLHTARRHYLGQKSCFESAQFERFFQLAASRLFAAGGLKLTQLLYRGEPVATDFNLFGNRTLFAYQGGMDPAAIAIRPGWLLTIATVRWAMEQGWQMIDFLRGDEPYKAHFRAEGCPMVNYRVVSNTASRGLWHGLWRTGEQAKKLATGDEGRTWQPWEEQCAVQLT